MSMSESYFLGPWGKIWGYIVASFPIPLDEFSIRLLDDNIQVLFAARGKQVLGTTTAYVQNLRSERDAATCYILRAGGVQGSYQVPIPKDDMAGVGTMIYVPLIYCPIPKTSQNKYMVPSIGHLGIASCTERCLKFVHARCVVGHPARVPT